jgi:hypothetical protein
MKKLLLLAVLLCVGGTVFASTGLMAGPDAGIIPIIPPRTPGISAGIIPIIPPRTLDAGIIPIIPPRTVDAGIIPIIPPRPKA